MSLPPVPRFGYMAAVLRLNVLSSVPSIFSAKDGEQAMKYSWLVANVEVRNYSEFDHVFRTGTLGFFDSVLMDLLGELQQH